MIYKRWAAMHGGVYAPVTPQTQPNQYLEFVDERDITTKGGQHHTLINPAYMTRQIHDIAKNEYGIKGHISCRRRKI